MIKFFGRNKESNKNPVTDIKSNEIDIPVKKAKDSEILNKSNEEIYTFDKKVEKRIIDDSNKEFDVKRTKTDALGKKTGDSIIYADETVKETAKEAVKKEKTTKVLEKILYKPLVKKKLTILLVENLADKVVNENVLKLIYGILYPNGKAIGGLVSIISYGNSVKVGEIAEVSELKDRIILSSEENSNNCLFDALVELEKVVSQNYMSITENEDERVRISDIDIIGIGTCKDSGSKTSKENAIDSFCKIFLKKDITTKYFCLGEDNFFDAAEIGFRSIGAIFRNYQ